MGKYFPEDINQLFIREVQKRSAEAIQQEKQDRFEFIVRQMKGALIARDRKLRLGGEARIRYEVSRELARRNRDKP